MTIAFELVHESKTYKIKKACKFYKKIHIKQFYPIFMNIIMIFRTHSSIDLSLYWMSQL